MTRARGQLRVLGLTGGIGAGKSTVARLCAARGVPVVDADALAREVVAPGGAAHAEVAAAWPEAIGPGGAVDRARLGEIVFADPAARRKLEGFTHPRIQEAAEARLDALAEGGARLALYEATLLVESGRWRDFDGLIVVVASRQTQIARATARGGLSRAQVEARLQAQLSTEARLKVATHVIDNDGALAATEAQVEALLAELGAPGQVRSGSG
ncbi:MAG TPA: dephospho-CoA kinase [Polyangia bacterium]|nr:dephospho-CoA kinase [Polyangia bacterium]